MTAFQIIANRGIWNFIRKLFVHIPRNDAYEFRYPITCTRCGDSVHFQISSSVINRWAQEAEVE